MYNVILDPEATDFLEKVEKKTAKRIWDKIINAKENPHHFFVRLTGRKDYKLRIGDYRAIADIDDKAKKIEITLIDHRNRIYRELR